MFTVHKELNPVWFVILENTTLIVNYWYEIKIIYKTNFRTPALEILTNVMRPLTT